MTVGPSFSSGLLSLPRKPVAGAARAAALAGVALLATAAPAEDQGEPRVVATAAERAAPSETASSEFGEEHNTRTPSQATLVRPAEPPPPTSLDEARGPDVTLIAGEERTVYEYRQNGKLRMIKVVPKLGKPYYLAPRDPTTGFGDLEQADTLVPRWVLIEF